MAARIRAFDWSKTTVGPVEQWPSSLQTAVQIMLGSRYPMFVWWGRGMTNFYNDAYIPVLGQRHPAALGQDAAVVWAEVWDILGPQAEEVLTAGHSTWNEELLLIMERYGYREETYFTFSYSPVSDGSGGVGGVFCACTEDTARVLGQRRLKTLRELAAETAPARSAEEACVLAAGSLSGNPHDIPFALLYLLEPEGRRVVLAGAAGIDPGAPGAPTLLELDERGPAWPLAEAGRAGRAVQIDGLVDRFGPLPGGPWGESPRAALALPLAAAGQARPAGFLVAGLSPLRPVDDDYRGFLELVAGSVATAIAAARAYEAERRRAEALAEIDRAKTTFFSNISHEFRTPLTLILGPLEDELAERSAPLPAPRRERLEAAHRNSLRLLKLVNTMLDFSRIEAGRLQASFEPLDLSTYTADLASVFRAAIERAGLRLVLDCPPLPEPVYVDREMWEKVMLNLLSNAFKHTFDGEVAVGLRWRGSHVEIEVRDTGVGIPSAELPHIFDRFHQVRGARSRTLEGTGIGLALVQELIRHHGGTVEVESQEGMGSRFVVRLPAGRAHLPPDRIVVARPDGPPRAAAVAYVEEALRWLPDERRDGEVDGSSDGSIQGPPAWPERDRVEAARAATGAPSQARILLVDDNADMRDYVRRLLSRRYQVETRSDGLSALEAVLANPPDLVLADVMMPGLDGFELLKAIRNDPATRSVPVILLSARAGEESRVEGLEAGADDYLIKPFSARELLARVGSHLELARVRREAMARESQLLAQVEALVAAAPVAVALLDRDLRYVRLNERLAAVNGLSIEQHLGRTFQEAVPELAPLYLPILRQVLETGRPLLNLPIEVPPRHPGEETGHWLGNVYPILDRMGEMQGLGVMLVDITPLRTAEAALRESEERFRLVARATHDGIYDWDIVHKRFWWNEAYERLFGRRPEESRGSLDWWIDHLHPDDREATLRSVQAAARGDAEFWTAEYRYRREDGSYAHVLDRAYITRDADGRARRFLGTMLDMTGIRRAEEALREADRRKDEFLAMLAHELRNPLSPILNTVYMLRLAGPQDPVVMKARDVIDRQVSHLSRMVDDLLDVSRITRGKILLRTEPLDLVSVVRTAVGDHQAQIAAAGVELVLELPEVPVPIEGDPTRLAQVVGNLLHNAAKFTDRDGKVTVRLEVDPGRGRARLTVRDTGIGMEPDILVRLFEPFSQADRSLDRSRGGLGLGLALVKGLVGLHGGRVRAFSPGTGLGSEIVVELPMGGARLATENRETAE